jgi:ribonuclease D
MSVSASHAPASPPPTPSAEPGPELSPELWIDRPEQLAALDAALTDTKTLALDTESNSMFVYRERLCLVQLGLVRPSGLALVAIDPLAFDAPETALAPLLTWLTRPDHRVLLHGGEYDIAVFKRDLGLAPTRLYDTQAAASMLGLARTGYANLVAEFLSIELDKAHQQFDWGRRPVPPGPRRYALDDVRHLPELAEILASMVADADLTEEVELACRAVAEARAHAPLGDAERFWRVVGGERLPTEVLARLHSLCLWREAEALARDVPPGRLVPSEVLIRLARRPPASSADLHGLGLGKKLIERPDALLAAAATPSSEVPDKPRKPAPNPQLRAREAKLKTWREAEAKRRGVSIQAVLPTRALESIAAGVALEAVPMLGDKRLRLYGDTLRALLR